VNAGSFAWILLAIALYGVIHSLLASLKAKSLAAAWFGSAGRRFYRLFFNFQSVITLIPVIALVGLLPDRKIYSIPFPVNLLTLILQLAAGLGLLLGVAQTGGMSFIGLEQLLDTSSQERPSRLVTAGFYRYVRHPLYSFGLVLLWLVPVMSWNLLALNIGLTGYILVGIIFEERKLVQEYGEAYREYQRSTPMLVPFTKKAI
jgi:methanethiol S-methyltransferase